MHSVFAKSVHHVYDFESIQKTKQNLFHNKTDNETTVLQGKDGKPAELTLKSNKFTLAAF